MLITDDYVELNEKLHAERPTYGAAGHKWADKVKQLCGMLHTQDVLDYGAGKGTLAKTLHFAIAEYDPAVSEVSLLPKPADLVVCTDVLEHIEPECLDDVLAHIHGLTLLRAFLVIATRPAHKTLPDGRNAHLIVQDEAWWREKLKPRFILTNVTARQDGEFAVLATPTLNLPEDLI